MGIFVLRVYKPNRKNLQQNVFLVCSEVLLWDIKAHPRVISTSKTPTSSTSYFILFFLLLWYLVDTQRLSWVKKEKKIVNFMPYTALSCGHYSGLSSPRLRLTSPHIGPSSSTGHGLNQTDNFGGWNTW